MAKKKPTQPRAKQEDRHAIASLKVKCQDLEADVIVKDKEIARLKAQVAQLAARNAAWSESRPDAVTCYENEFGPRMLVHLRTTLNTCFGIGPDCIRSHHQDAIRQLGMERFPHLRASAARMLFSNQVRLKKDDGTVVRFCDHIGVGARNQVSNTLILLDLMETYVHEYFCEMGQKAHNLNELGQVGSSPDRSMIRA